MTTAWGTRVLQQEVVGGSNVAGLWLGAVNPAMKVERKATTLPAEKPSIGASVIDVLDHVLDKGIVIDAHVRVGLAGIDLITVEARVLVASIDTYLQHSEAVRHAEGFVDGYRLSLPATWGRR